MHKKMFENEILNIFFFRLDSWRPFSDFLFLQFWFSYIIHTYLLVMGSSWHSSSQVELKRFQADLGYCNFRAENEPTIFTSILRPTVACIIVRRLLIIVHKWQSSGMAATHEYWSQHEAHLVYLPIFHGLNLIIFS